MDVRRSTSRWTISLRAAVVARLVPVAEAAAEAALRALDEAVRVRVHLAVPEVRLPLEPVAQWLLLFRALQLVTLRRLRQVVVDKLVAAEEAVPVAVAEVPLEVQEAVGLRLWRATLFVRVLQFPAWRSLMCCSQQAPIQMWRSARVVRKPVPADASPIRCSAPEPRRCIVQR